MPASNRRDLLVALIGPLAEAEGFDLEDVEVAQVGRRSRIRVLVDKSGGVSLDECAQLSRTVGEHLDAHDEIGDEPYTLEVSSPGVSRPLTLPRHWKRNVGRLVSVALRSGGTLEGRIGDADDEAATVNITGRLKKVPYADVAKAKIQVEFKRVDKARFDDEAPEYHDDAVVADRDAATFDDEPDDLAYDDEPGVRTRQNGE